MAVITSIAETARVVPVVALSPTVEFEIKRRLKLWVVLRDNVYSGSFPEQEGAVQAADREIKAIIRAGGKAQMRPDDAI